MPELYQTCWRSPGGLLLFITKGTAQQNRLTSGPCGPVCTWTLFFTQSTVCECVRKKGVHWRTAQSVCPTQAPSPHSQTVVYQDRRTRCWLRSKSKIDWFNCSLVSLYLMSTFKGCLLSLLCLLAFSLFLSGSPRGVSCFLISGVYEDGYVQVTLTSVQHIPEIKAFMGLQNS